MSEAYQNFVKEHERLMQQVHDINAQINQNRLDTAALIGKWDESILQNDTATADELKEQVEKKETDFKWLSREAELLSRSGARTSPTLKKIGGQVFTEARADMAKIKKDWDKHADAINKAMATMLECAAQLGGLSKQADKIKRRCEQVTTITSQNFTYIQSPAEVAINKVKKTGLIYPDVKAIELAYNTGKAKK